MTPTTQTVVKGESIRRRYIRNTRKFKLVLESSDRHNSIGVEQQIDVKGGFFEISDLGGMNIPGVLQGGHIGRESCF